MDFKIPTLPPSGSKRKEPPQASSSNGSGSGFDSSKRSRQSYNAADPLSGASRVSSSNPGRTSNSFPVPSIPLKTNEGGRSKAPAVSVTDVQDEDMPLVNGRSGADDEDYRGNDDTYEADEDDEEGGRFFGGGTNATQETILDMFAGVEDAAPGSSLPSIPELKRQIRKFESIVTKNLEMRSRFPDDPTKFLESEADLDRAFTFLLPLTQNPVVYYPELVEHETLIPTLTNLLTHENTDIALQSVSVLYELTDEEVGEDLVEEEEDEDKRDALAKAVRLVMGDFIQALLDNSLLDLLVPNLSRLNEEEEDADRTGVFNIIGIFENLLAFLPPLASQIVNQTELLPWLLKRITAQAYDSNKQYASELLSILTQEDREVRLRVEALGGVDTLLQVLSQYRKKDPEDSEELEFMENVFDTLCSILAEPEIKKAFLEAEGNELMVLIMKEKALARTRAIKVLDYALQTADGADNCVRFVEAMGLKSLFNVFMGRGTTKKSKLAATSSTFEDEEHVLSILSSLFSNLASDTVSRIRLLAKFVENDYEKIDRLLEMRESAQSRMKTVNKEIGEERYMMEANGEQVTEVELDDWYLRRINAGLAQLQNADYCLAWMAMEDDGAANHTKMLMSRKGGGFPEVVGTLKEMRNMMSSDNLEEMEKRIAEGGEDVSGHGSEDDPETQEKVMILTQLINFCQAL